MNYKMHENNDSVANCSCCAQKGKIHFEQEKLICTIHGVLVTWEGDQDGLLYGSQQLDNCCFEQR